MKKIKSTSLNLMQEKSLECKRKCNSALDMRNMTTEDHFDKMIQKETTSNYLIHSITVKFQL